MDALYMQATLVAGRVGRLADDRLPDARRPPLLRRHLLPEDRPRRPARLLGPVPGDRGRLPRPAATTWRPRRRRSRGGWRACLGAAGVGGGARRRRSLDDADRRASRGSSTPSRAGFGGAPKFPPSLALEFLLRRLGGGPTTTHARQMVDLTLGRMAAGGIYDQVGGGFHRYSVDGRWLVPHFEKMLYDNALLARDYALAPPGHGHRRARPRRPGDARLPAARDAPAAGAASGRPRTPTRRAGEGAFFVWTPRGARIALLTPHQAARGDAPLRRHRGGQLRGAVDPPPGGAARARSRESWARTPGRCWCRRARSLYRARRRARRRRATTSSSPPGTGSRSPRSPTPG